MDLQKTRLYVKCKICDIDGGMPDQEVVFPVNQSMIKTLLNNCENEGMKQKLCTELFYEDTPGAHDSLNNNPMNEGNYYRKRIAGSGNTFEMEGSLGEDVLNLENYIINGVDFDLKLYPVRSAFSLMSDTPAKEYSLIIEAAILKMCTVDVGNTIVSAHNHSLERGGMAQYFFTQSNLNNYSLSMGQRNFSQTIFQGNIPHKIVVAFVSSDRYNGSYSLNPFHFQHYHVSNMSVFINDVSTPHRPLEMDFKRGYFASALHNILQNNSNVVIGAQSFDRGYSLFVFDVNTSSNDEELALQTSGTVRLEVQFEEEVPESVQVLVYGEFQSCF